jgi:UDP-glucose 4-epimerase
MQKVVVTGGAGFIGSNLVNSLVKEGYEVHVLDNLSTGKKENLNEKATLHIVDIRDFNKISKVISGASYVFHLAAIASVPFSIERPSESNDVNLGGTIAVLEASVRAGVKRVIFASSCAIYGEQEKMPISEEAKPNPISPYALQKFMAEVYCKFFSQLYGLETVVLRYFNCYGPNMTENGPYTSVIKKWLDQAKQDKQLLLFGGNQTRDFVYVDDLAEASLAAMKSSKVGNGEAINVGSGESIALEKLAKKISNNIDKQEKRKGDIEDSLADISKAKDLLDWQPKISLAEGIKNLKELGN